MVWIDSIIFLGIMLITLLGTLLLSLIPKSDYLAQEKAVRFFSLATICLICRLGYSLWRGLFIQPISLKTNILGFRFSLLLTLEVRQLFLFLLLSAVLFFRVFFYGFGERKGSASSLLGHMILFSLGFFILFFDQIEQSLFFMSLSTIVVCAMISKSQQAFRGSAIYQSAIFLYIVDALALILIHIPSLKSNRLLQDLAPIVLLLPGLTRMLISFFSPWGKKLIKNSYEKDQAFIASFFAIIGFAYLLEMKATMWGELPIQMINVISSICVLSAIYSSLAAILEKNPQILCFHFFSYYTALSTSLFFASSKMFFSFLGLTILSTSIVCFFSCHIVAHQINKSIPDTQMEKKARVLWFASLCLLVGTPGLGTGTALWPALYNYVGIFLQSPDQKPDILLLSQLLGWFVGLLLLSGAVVASIRLHIRRPKKSETQLPKWHYKKLWISHVMVNLICWLIPFYLFSQK